MFFSFGEKNQKNLNGVLLLGLCAVVMPASIGVWDVCEDSDITVVLFGVRTKHIKACHPERSRTFGFVSGNIANKSKSENCQDNFRDLLGFIWSFWLKSNFLCCVGLHLTLL